MTTVKFLLMTTVKFLLMTTVKFLLMTTVKLLLMTTVKFLFKMTTVKFLLMAKRSSSAILKDFQPGKILTKCMTMHLVNLAKSSKSIFEFIFVPVLTGFFSSQIQGGGGGCEEPCITHRNSDSARFSYTVVVKL